MGALPNQVGMGRARSLFLPALVLTLLALFASPSVRGKEVTLYDLEGAYLVRFLDFVEWPPSAFADSGAPFILGILGDDPFGENLDRQVNGRLFNGRRVEVRRFDEYDPDEGPSMRECNILFIASSEKGDLGSILKSLQQAPVLTVSEMERFPLYGGVIGFEQEGPKVRLMLNKKAAQKARLKLSARLLQVCHAEDPE